jgi:hypothetical protein
MPPGELNCPKSFSHQLPEGLIFVKFNRGTVPGIRKPYAVIEARALMGANRHEDLFISGRNTINGGNPIDSIANFI